MVTNCNCVAQVTSNKQRRLVVSQTKHDRHDSTPLRPLPCSFAAIMIYVRRHSPSTALLLLGVVPGNARTQPHAWFGMMVILSGGRWMTGCDPLRWRSALHTDRLLQENRKIPRFPTLTCCSTHTRRTFYHSGWLRRRTTWTLDATWVTVPSCGAAMRKHTANKCCTMTSFQSILVEMLVVVLVLFGVQCMRMRRIVLLEIDS